MKKLIDILAVLLLAPARCWRRLLLRRGPACIACGDGLRGGVRLDSPRSITDVSACSVAPQLFVNYCLNCHSASYMRYNRLTGSSA